MEIKKYTSRAEIPVEETWAIEDLFATDEVWSQELDTLPGDTQELASYKGILGSSAETLLEYLQKMEAIDSKTELLGSYCARKADQDTRDSAARAMQGRFRTLLAALGAAASFETPEIMAIPDETLDEFYAQCPGLERYRRYLTDMRRMKEHTLSAAEERLLAAAAEMAGSPQNVFSAFSNADLTFPDAVDSEGKTHTLTKGSLINLLKNPDRALRKDAYEKMFSTVRSFRNTAAAMLNGQGKQLKFYADARKYPSTLDAALDRNNVPTSVYHNLIEAVHQNLPTLHRYMALRKRLMGLDELHFYDVYMPILADYDKKIPFDEAKQTVHDALYPLGEEYQAILREGFANRWIDVHETPGKRGGAYSSGSAVHPFILLNYNHGLTGQFTLAHEMGHAVHSYLSNRTQNPVDAHYKIFVAEVASTCNEALMIRYLLDRSNDKRERAYLINHFLEKFRTTLCRQTMFAEFELFMGNTINQGGTLTADLLCAEYKRLNEMYYGPDMVMDDYIACEWARIPHMYYNYYVFQYATGFSAAVALSTQILQEGAPAVERYFKFLSSGCTRSPIDLLKDAGVDMTTPAPVNDALALFAKLLDEMEELMEG